MFKFTFIINSPDKPMGEVKPYGNEAAFIDHITLQIKQVAELKGIYSVNKQSSLFTPQFWFSTENELKKLVVPSTYVKEFNRVNHQLNEDPGCFTF